MSAELLLDILNEREVLPDRLLAKLRAKIAESDKPMSATMLAKFLVQKKHLSPQQANDYLSLLQAQMADAAVGPAPANNRSDFPQKPEAKVDPPLVETKPKSQSPPPSESPSSSSSIFSAILPSQVPSSEEAKSTDEDQFTLMPIDEEEPEDPETVGQLAEEMRPQNLAPVHDLEELSATKLAKNEPHDLMKDPLVADANLAASSSALRSPSSILRSNRKSQEKKIRRKVERHISDESKRSDRKRRKSAKRKSKNEWESPLLLIGGGALALLVLCGVTVFLVLRWESGEDQLREADAKLSEGSYSQAIPLYDKFLTDYPGHAEWSTARVKLAMARLRRDTESGNFEIALATAQDELDEVENEEQFAEVANAELAALLPRIARGLADRAESEAADPEQADKWTAAANEALGLCLNTKYVLKSLRDDAELDAIEETLARVDRRQQTGRDLDEALTAMQTSIADGDTRAAYAAHRQLIQQHPELGANDDLMAMMVKTSAAELAGVKFVVDEQPAETTERPTPWIAALATANRHGGAKSATGGTFCVRVDGAVYGLDVASGQLLWRRYVGFAESAPPITQADHAFVADTTHQELLRLDARSGKLVWRQAIGEPFAEPLIVGGRAYISAESGRLYVVDVQSGQRMGYLQFAQPLHVSPIVDRQGEQLYLTGDHSSIYTISLKDLMCQGVYYFGHSAGSIRVPPALVLDKMALLENDGVATCRLHLLSLDEQGIVAGRDAERRLTGLASAAPLVAGRRLLVVTDRGQLDAYDVGGGSGDGTLTLVATREPTSQQPVKRHVLLTQGAIWVGDLQLTKYAVLPTGNRLPVQGIDNNFAGATFDHPLGLFGGTLVHARRPANRAGVVVAAMDADRGESLWETDLAVPPIATPVVDGNRTLAFADANAVIYQFDKESIRARVQDQPIQPASAPSLLPKLTSAADLGDGRAAYVAAGESDQVLLYDPSSSSKSARWVHLPSTVACAVSPFDQGLLVPLEVGQVFYLNPADGESLALPYQPRLQPRTKLRYQPAGAIEGAPAQFVITDGHEKIYVVALANQPQPHLMAVTEARVGAYPIISPITVMGDSAFAITQDGGLARFQLPGLEAAGTTNLPGEVVWGPYRVGDSLLMASANEQLMAAREDGAIAWTKSLDSGELVGPPLSSGGDVLIAYRNGIVERRNLADGEPDAKIDVEQPLAGGPVRYQQRIVLTTHDGTLLVVDEP